MKISDKISSVSDNFEVVSHDNGFVVTVNGHDKNDQWKNVRIVVSTVAEVVELFEEYSSMEKSD